MGLSREIYIHPYLMTPHFEDHKMYVCDASIRDRLERVNGHWPQRKTMDAKAIFFSCKKSCHTFCFSRTRYLK